MRDPEYAALWDAEHKRICVECAQTVVVRPDGTQVMEDTEILHTCGEIGD